MKVFLLTQTQTSFLCNFRTENQKKVLTKLRDKNIPEISVEDICERSSKFVEEMNRKNILIQNRIVDMVDDMEYQQSPIVQKILSRVNCSNTGVNLEKIPETLDEVKTKIVKFENKLKDFAKQKTILQTQSMEQMKLLKEITDKLSKHDGNFENFEKRLPVLIKTTKEAAEKSPNNSHRLPMDIVLGLTKNSVKDT